MICPKCHKNSDRINFEIEPDMISSTGSIDIDDNGVCIGGKYVDYIYSPTGPEPGVIFTCPICKFDLTEFIDADEFWDLF